MAIVGKVSGIVISDTDREEKMSTTKTTGGCLCGKVAYEISGEPMFSAHCCCVDCRKASGADHITLAFFGADQVAITGEVQGFDMTADSGNTNTRQFCPTCGSRLFSYNSARSEAVGIQVGTMNNPQFINPKAVVYAKDRCDWDHFSDALPQFEKMPPPPPEK